MTQATDISEAELVTRSAAGDREAFADLVRRYQSLICAIAYNGTGNLSQSEDVSQEVFVTAWRKLGELREREKFRPWLCGIARNLINNARRASRRHPMGQMDGVELEGEAAREDEAPVEQAISREEEAILWRALEKIPETYREPMILFYRQQHSMERVAEVLELSEDAVKQRLSRGRKLLQGELAAFVEGALERSNPGKAFAVGVVVALPTMATSAKAAAMGAGAAKGSATAKGAAMMGMVGALLSPLMMATGIWAGYRLVMETARSEGEQAFIKAFYRRLMFCIGAFLVGFALLCAYGRGLERNDPTLFSAVVIGGVVAYAVATVALMAWSRAKRRALRAAGTPENGAFRALPLEEYRSARTLLGVPLLHMRRHGGVNDAPTFGWIAIGDNTRGLLFAFGGSAVAPIAVGGNAIGIVAWGGLAIGVFSMGGFSIGLWALGGLAVGWHAFGGCALGWKLAVGGIAVGHDLAAGVLAHAAHWNDQVVQKRLEGSWFYGAGRALSDYGVLFNALWAVPLVLWWRGVRRRKLAAGK